MSKELAISEAVENLPAPNELKIEFVSLPEKRFKSPAVSSVNSVNELSFLGFLYMLITKTFIKCGQPIEADKVEVIVGLFAEEILDDFPRITIKEIEKAFKDGYKGHYGKYYGLNVLTFISWIDFFVKNVRNKELLKLKPIDESDALPELSESAIKEILVNGCIRCFNEFKEDGSLPIASGHIYKFLDSRGVLKFSDKELEKINIIAIQKLRKKFDPLNARNGLEKKEFSKIFRSIKTDESGRLEIMEQELKLISFFKKLLVSNTQIEDLKL